MEGRRILITLLHQSNSEPKITCLSIILGLNICKNSENFSKKFYTNYPRMEWNFFMRFLFISIMSQDRNKQNCSLQRTFYTSERHQFEGLTATCSVGITQRKIFPKKPFLTSFLSWLYSFTSLISSTFPNSFHPSSSLALHPRPYWELWVLWTK